METSTLNTIIAGVLGLSGVVIGMIFEHRKVKTLEKENSQFKTQLYTLTKINPLYSHTKNGFYVDKDGRPFCNQCRDDITHERLALRVDRPPPDFFYYCQRCKTCYQAHFSSPRDVKRWNPLDA